MAKLSPRDIKRKIQGIKNTQRITKAMKAVSAAKLNKAKAMLNATRPYSERLYDLINDLAMFVDRDIHPLLKIREEKKIDYVVITADRGLAGAFNSYVIKRALSDIKKFQEEEKEVNLILIGRKAVQFFKNKGFNTIEEYEDIYRDHLNLAFTSKVGGIIAERYENEKTDAVYMVNNELITTATYETRVRKLFPIEPELDYTKLSELSRYNIEPSAEEVLEELLKRYINFQLYRALVESSTAEHAARMLAMDNATRNAGEAIKRWTIIFNKARQEAITTELIDIINAANAIE
ncbi:F0F1 ATP synthase subunit gamma [Persephonella sp.]|uniref:F0F1 ATP synthase subunit gamma n=1 Tax=Persephonella sp. TaxID=2060922 RepID=UPI0025D48B06|nr:F0F1 ATP synthase subunit gamma [Persephonella sp.]